MSKTRASLSKTCAISQVRSRPGFRKHSAVTLPTFNLKITRCHVLKSQGTGMGSCKRVSNWTVEEVHVWATAQYPSSQATFRQAVSSHAISGRALLRMSEHQLERMGVGAKQQREILRDILLLRVREELENLNDIFVECFSS
ncbi:sterile alpha motif domain-containing protein 12-like isoform X2 [Anguilla rostrata]|uniref:sterile alpha motif domain-containing protein 12-like isoform X2 n=1 Tax=Anguilla rostrata TaxID=7938 RepID=UPI0030D3ADC2